MEPNLEELTLINQVQSGLSTHNYFNDKEGNIWVASERAQGRPEHFKLFRKAEDITYPTLSMEQVLQAAAEREKPSNTIRFN